MQQSSLKHKAPTPRASAHQLRLHPSVHLCRGETVGAFVESMFRLDDGPRFGPASGTTTAEDLQTRLVSQLQQLAAYCDATETDLRPLILPVPVCILEMPALIESCIDMIAHTKLCPQELSFEFTDAELVRNTGFDFNLFRSLRMRGLRVGIDARTSWRATLQPMSWLMVDTLRVTTEQIGLDQALDDMVASAVDAGVSIVADKPRWRDGDYLARAGIEYGVQPYADA